MSFFDKVKQGATDAAKKAQQTVEITRLKAQISSKEREIDKIYKIIGESVYTASFTGGFEQIQTNVSDLCLSISQIQGEISEIELKITEIKNEKECVCGKVVVADTKFCSSCGHQFA